MNTRFVLCGLVLAGYASVTLAAPMMIAAPQYNGQQVGVGYSWFQSEEDPQYWGLYKDGVQIAGYDRTFDEWREYNRATDKWTKPSTPPWGRRTAPNKPGNFGNDFKPIEEAPKVKYRINGKPASREAAIDTIRAAAPKLPNDKDKLRVIAIGPGRQAVDKDMATSPALAPVKDKVVYGSYDSNEWEVKDYKAQGMPTISIIDPKTGREIHRQDDYDGPDVLAAQIVSAEQIRTPDPNYTPANTPDLRKDLLSNPDLQSLVTALGIFGVVYASIRSKL